MTYNTFIQIMAELQNLRDNSIDGSRDHYQRLMDSLQKAFDDFTQNEKTKTIKLT